MLAKGGFHLTKWVSNSKEVINALPQSERAVSVKDLDFAKPHLERALGVQWNVTSDKFAFKISIREKPATRTGMLCVVSSIYDPLGFAAPFILEAKLVLQDLCRKKFGWDNEISEEHQQRWRSWLKELSKLEELTINRCFKPADFGEITSSELHHFPDAAQQGYGTATYLRIVDNRGKIHCSLVMGKLRLAPLKSVTIPRMELSAVVVVTRLDKMVREELDLPVNQSIFWTDSTCVLRYINNEATRFQTFVANRIATIRQATTPSQWRYVDTQSNPADEASRGVSADSLECWINGPSFLSQSNDKWPQQPADLDDSREEEMAFKAAKVCVITTIPSSTAISDLLFKRFSSWDRLKKIIAWILRYKANLRKSIVERKLPKSTTLIHSQSAIESISVTEMNNTELEIFKLVEEESFKEELLHLRQLQRSLSQKKYLKKTSSIYKLDPIMNRDIMRVGGRLGGLGRAPLFNDIKHPVILPKNHHIVNLIIMYYHKVSGHSGLEYTLLLVREWY